MMKLDTSKFDKAVIEYAAASRKDHSWCVNKNLQETAIRSIRFAKKSSAGVIKALAKEEALVWWLAWKSIRKHGISRSEAYETAKKQIGRRTKAVGFIKSFFIRMSALLAPYTGNYAKSRVSKGSLLGFTPIVKPATPGNLAGYVGMRYDYKHRGDSTAKKTEQLLYSALQLGMNDAVANMRTYIEKKIRETAKRYFH
jgi:hypothetical protein